MCGVVGWLDCRSSVNLGNDTGAVLDRMRDSLVHRGPDDFGSWTNDSGQVALANRRLSIVDLSERARQPMISETADIVLSYNGEVYNHLELRGQLERLGYRFRSNCDSETVLYAFQEWGIECLSRFKGQYAFAIWDGRSQTVYLARDRVGLQPLYFYSHDGLVVFGSEFRAIVQHPDVRARLNIGGFYQYFVMHAPAPPFTLLENVYVVPAGSYVRCPVDKTPQLVRHWSILDELGKQDLSGMTENELAERIRETLMQAVQRRLMSDRPVGMFLSGGVDSTSVLACLAALGSGNLRSYSIGYSDEKTLGTKDEFSFAAEAAKEFQSPHTMLRTQPDRLMEFANSCDKPPENLVEFWLWEMAEVAGKAGVPVMLHGEGADELFFGYDFHWKVLSERQRVQSEPGCDLDGSPFDSGVPPALRSLTSRERTWDSTADLMFWGGGVHPKIEYQRRDYFGSGYIPDRLQTTSGLDTSLFRPVSADADVLSFVRACFDTSRSADHGTDYRHRMQFLEFVHKLPEVLLRRGEPSCMKHSVEMRLPFLDEDLIALAVNLPLASLRSPTVVKYPLRLAMKGMIPERIRMRPKEFFGISFLGASQKWPSANPWFRHYLLESRFASLGLVSKGYLETQYQRLTRDNVGFETFLWKHVFTAVWYDNFISKVTQ